MTLPLVLLVGLERDNRFVIRSIGVPCKILYFFRRMDKKHKKQLDNLRTRLQKLRNQLAGAKKQKDDPEEVRRLEKDLAHTEAEIERLKDAN